MWKAVKIVNLQNVRGVYKLKHLFGWVIKQVFRIVLGNSQNYPSPHGDVDSWSTIALGLRPWTIVHQVWMKVLTVAKNGMEKLYND